MQSYTKLNARLAIIINIKKIYKLQYIKYIKNILKLQKLPY